MVEGRWPRPVGARWGSDGLAVRDPGSGATRLAVCGSGVSRGRRRARRYPPPACHRRSGRCLPRQAVRRRVGGPAAWVVAHGYVCPQVPHRARPNRPRAGWCTSRTAHSRRDSSRTRASASSNARSSAPSAAGCAGCPPRVETSKARPAGVPVGPAESLGLAVRWWRVGMVTSPAGALPDGTAVLAERGSPGRGRCGGPGGDVVGVACGRLVDGAVRCRRSDGPHDDVTARRAGGKRCTACGHNKRGRTSACPAGDGTHDVSGDAGGVGAGRHRYLRLPGAHGRVVDVSAWSLSPFIKSPPTRRGRQL